MGTPTLDSRPQATTAAPTAATTTPSLSAPKSAARSLGYAAGAAALKPALQLKPDPAPASCPVPPATPGVAPTTGLTNRRFAGDSTLQDIANGKGALKRNSKGPAVRKIQAALESLGQPLPKYHADGSFGEETETALKAYQAAESLITANMGTVDQATILYLDGKTPQASAEVYEWREQETSTATTKKRSRIANPRFSGDPVLEMLMSGIGALMPGAKGVSVWKVQMALKDLGFKLGADGGYGTETKTAVAAFQDAYNVTMAPTAPEISYTKAAEEKGLVNGATMAALDAYAPKVVPSATPDPKLSSAKAPDYAKLFADGKFEVTIAQGYDDNPGHVHIQKKIQTIQYLTREMDFQMTDPRTASADEVSKAGLDPKTVDKELIYFTKKFFSKAVGKEVQCIVKLLSAKDDGSDGAGRLDRFKKAMEEDDSVLYTGHARAGTGPDFDPHDSTAGNYVMGNGYSPEYNKEIKSAKNQLDDTKFTDKYQVYHMWGCTTQNYQKHMDRRLGKKGAKGGSLHDHKDIVMTNQSIPSVRGLAGTLGFLRGMLAEASAAELHVMGNAAMRMDVSKEDIG